MFELGSFYPYLGRLVGSVGYRNGNIGKVSRMVFNIGKLLKTIPTGTSTIFSQFNVENGVELMQRLVDG